MKLLQVITTGGTIDKIYYDAKSDYQIGEPEIARILADMNVAFRWQVQPLLRKDSLQLTDADRDLIAHAVAASDASHFLITHGTDTMVETALRLEALTGRVIVLTGALNPARFLGSDAMFNIGCAVGAVQCLPDGVWIAMNGRVWNPHAVRKNRDANRFEPVAAD
ncbi:MAG: asparaginase domain-containing protein [Wenzhouxiangellaceae bacterium]|nr:asparaginase domain-containing protein [Wenzhouxiangellaceae bacterium]